MGIVQFIQEAVYGSVSELCAESTSLFGWMISLCVAQKCEIFAGKFLSAFSLKSRIRTVVVQYYKDT